MDGLIHMSDNISTSIVAPTAVVKIIELLEDPFPIVRDAVMQALLTMGSALLLWVYDG